MTILGDRIKQRRVEIGLSQDELAAATKMRQQSIQQIEAGDTQRPRKLHEIARSLRTSVEWLLGEADGHPVGALAEAPTQFLPQSNVSAPVPTVIGLGQPRDLPVVGRAVGGEETWFEFNGEVLDRLHRPPSLNGAKDAYALFVSGTSMEPRYMEGETIYINPARPVRAGDFVVAQVRPRRRGEPIRGLIKQLRAKSVGKIVLASLNPPNAPLIEFPADQIISLHLIVLSGEG